MGSIPGDSYWRTMLPGPVRNRVTTATQTTPWENVDLSEPEASVKTSFRMSNAAHATLRHLSSTAGVTMKDEIDLIALELFHPDQELRAVLDEFIERGAVGREAGRKPQTVSSLAKNLIERKARALAVSRDQVLQQAILFRAAMERYSTPNDDELDVARAELSPVLAAAGEAEERVNSLLGRKHWFAARLQQLHSSLLMLAGDLDRFRD